MSEYQDIQATKTYNTTEWHFVGFGGENEDGWRVYQTNNGDLFAVDAESDRMSFEVYNEDGIFIIY